MKQITMMEDGNVIIKHHYFKSIVKKPYKRHIRRKHDGSEVMLVKEYNKKVGQWRNRLKSLKIIKTRSLFLTMTISDKTYNNQTTMNIEFDKVIESLKKELGIKDVEYIKIFQIQPSTNNLHIHSILLFNNNINQGIKQYLNTDWLKQHWTLGTECCVETIYEVAELINYLTKRISKNTDLICFEEDCDLDFRERRTIFQKGKHIVSISKNFPKQKIIKRSITDEKYSEFKNTNKYKHKGYKTHVYIDRECIDEEYLQIEPTVKSFDKVVKELS